VKRDDRGGLLTSINAALERVVLKKDRLPESPHPPTESSRRPRRRRRASVFAPRMIVFGDKLRQALQPKGPQTGRLMPKPRAKFPPLETACLKAIWCSRKQREADAEVVAPIAPAAYTHHHDVLDRLVRKAS